MNHIHIKEVDRDTRELLQENFICSKCGKCCSMTLVVSNYDILKIKKQGYTDFYEQDILGRNVLKMNNDKCIFLKEVDGSFLCAVYEVRPKGCSDYPFFNNILMECDAVEK